MARKKHKLGKQRVKPKIGIRDEPSTVTQMMIENLRRARIENPDTAPRS